jgi:Fuc2NAc and GlcNAc transferase
MNWAVTIGAFLVSLVLVGLLRQLAFRADMLDVPNARSSHPLPIPRGGGLAIVVATLVAAAAEAILKRGAVLDSLAWLAGGSLVALAGFLDDLRGLSAIKRLGFHFGAAAILLLATGGMPDLPWPGGTVALGTLGWIIGAIAIVWSINLFNFMDGIDGLAAAQAIFVIVSAVWLQGSDTGRGAPLPLLALAGAATGFLVWNFPPAKIFMGDVGSGFIGFALAAGALLTARHGPTTLWTWLVLNGVFVADATVTLLVRLVRRERVYEAHRQHLYQRLSRRWRSHRTVTMCVVAVNLLWCLPWAFATVRVPDLGAVFTAVGLGPLLAIVVLRGGEQVHV